MKLGKNILLVLLFCSAGLVHARAVRKTTVPVKATVETPVVQSKTKQPLVQGQSYAQALTAIRTTMRADQVWKDNKFTDLFVTFVKNSVHNSDYADIFARALFEAGANLHVQFTGDNSIDKTIVIDINNAINQQMNLLRVKPFEQPIIIKKTEISAQRMHVVPTAAQVLSQFGLCPLFTAPAYYFVFKENRLLSSGERAPGFEGEDVAMNAPCVAQLGKFGHWNRVLMQLKSLDQFELADKSGLSAAMCGGLSLNNGRLIRKYALTGDVQCLNDLHSINDSAKFLRNLNIGDWLNVEIVRNNLPKLAQELGVDGIDVSAVSTVALFDSNLDKTPAFGVFNPEEFFYVQSVKKKIQQGLKENNYLHVIIVGNEEQAEDLGHYFCFAIIKVANEIQYVVLDTIPSAYHLQPKSHQRDRLMFVIDNVEQGNSLVKVANLRTRPEFIHSIGEVSEESLLEKALADERMKESDLFKNQIKLLNGISTALFSFGIKKQLLKESKESLMRYLDAIQEISNVLGQDVSYPALKKLIEKELMNYKK